MYFIEKTYKIYNKLIFKQANIIKIIKMWLGTINHVIYLGQWQFFSEITHL